MFGVGVSYLVGDWYDLFFDVVGFDWRFSIDEVRLKGIIKIVQGNLDLFILFVLWEVIEKKMMEIFDQGMKLDSFIFNFGYGVFLDVSFEVLKKLIVFVYKYL